MPVVALVNLGAAEANAQFVNAFSEGLEGAGWVEGQNMTVEYHWLEGQFDHMSSLMADLVRRRVAVIATPAGNYASQEAKAATTRSPLCSASAKTLSGWALLPATHQGARTEERLADRQSSVCRRLNSMRHYG